MALREARRVLFNRLDGVERRDEFLTVQVDIAEAILAAERELLTGHSDSLALESHIRSLRLYADALAWWTLHPHAIRQLAKNPAPPQSLLSQGRAFNNVLRNASSYLEETGLPILIADITNVIKIGDIILVVDPEHPRIVECKTKLPAPQRLMQGRIGRQVSRAMGTMKYLDKGEAKVFGERHHRMTVESQHRAERCWTVIDELCGEALQDGEAFLEISPGDWLWALRPEREGAVLCVIAEKHKGSGVAQFGTSLGLMNRQDGLYPPPSAWRPVSREVRFQLIEGTVLLFHLVCYDALAGDYGDGQRITISNGDYPIVVTIEGQDYPLSRRFIYDVVYGFETVESCVKGLLLFAQDLASAVPPDLPDVGGAKPSMWYVESEQDLALLVRRKDVPQTDYVSMPRVLVDVLSGAERRGEINKGSLAVMTFGALRELIAKSGSSNGASWN